MSYEYTLINGELHVKNIISGATFWKGNPEGRTIISIVPIPNETDCIVLLDFDESNPKDPDHNLIRVHPDGTIIWRAELPDQSTSDAYTQIVWTSKGLSASSWSGYYVTIDLNFGTIISSSFVK